MNERARSMKDGPGPTWPSGSHTVESRRWEAQDDSQSTTLLLQHPLDPFVKTLPDSTETTIQVFATSYLARVTNSDAGRAPLASLPAS